MATTPNGIMTLPENDQMGAPQLSLNESYDAMRQGLKNARPDAAADVDSTMAEILPQLDGMPDDVIDKLLQTVQYLKDNPDQYAEVVAKLISMGVVKEGDFPPEYDPEFLATMGIVLLEAQRSRSQAPLQPTGFASGGLADAARIMAAQGRGRDSMLAHITPSEASLLRSRGGMGTRNPSTGLPEYGFFDDLWSGFKGAVTGVFDAVKGILKSPIGRVVGTIALGAFLGPGAFGITGLGLGAAAAPLASGLISGLSGGSAMDMLTSAATSYLGSSASPLSQYVGNLTSGLGLGSMASQALTSGLVGTGVGLLTGKSLEDSVSSGLQGAAMNADMDYMNTNKAPVSAADRASVSDAVIKPVPDGLAPDIGSGLKAGSVRSPYELDSPASGGLGLKPPAGISPSQGINLRGGATPAPVAETTAAPVVQTGDYKYPELTDSMGKMFKSGTFMEGAKDTFFPSGPTDDQVLKSSQFEAFKKQGFTGKEAFERASNSLSPGMFRQYGPLAAAGLGIMGLTGGFDQKPLQQSALNASLTGGAGSYQDLMAKNPRKYYAQHLPGVLYDDNGAIIGYQGPGGSRQLYNQGGAVGYAEGGEAWNGPAWGPNSMVYPSIAAAIAAGVPRNKLFKTALEAYRGKANVVTPYVPPVVPVVPPVVPVVPPVVVDSITGGGGNDSIAPRDTTPIKDNGLFASIWGRTTQDAAPVTEKSTFTQAALNERTAQQLTPTDKQDSSRDDVSGINPNPLGGDVTSTPAGLAPAPVGPSGIASLGIVSDKDQAIAIGFQDAERDREDAAKESAILGSTTPTPTPTAIAGGIYVDAKNAAAAAQAQQQAAQAQADREAANRDRQVEAQAQAQRAAAAAASAMSRDARADAAAAASGARNFGKESSIPEGGMVSPGVGGGDGGGGIGNSGSGAGTSNGGAQAKGGYIGSYAQGGMGSNGIASLLQGGYPRKIGEIAGPGTGTSDDIPAMLSDGEFVMTAKAVRGAGKGSRRDGAKRMYALMHQLERNAARG